MKSLLTGSLPPSLSPGERSPWVGLSFQPSNHRQRASPLNMNNKRHLSYPNHSGNFKGQRSSVPGTSYKDQSHVFLILSQYMQVLVVQSCLTLCDPMDCSPPGSSVLHITTYTLSLSLSLSIYIYICMHTM